MGEKDLEQVYEKAVEKEVDRFSKTFMKQQNSPDEAKRVASGVIINYFDTLAGRAIKATPIFEEEGKTTTPLPKKDDEEKINSLAEILDGKSTYAASVILQLSIKRSLQDVLQKEIEIDITQEVGQVEYKIKVI